MNLDTQRIQEFGGKLIGTLNNAALALMTSIGHQTELFDVMAKLPPSTSEQIARASGLSERYVREWLSAMTTGGIVEHDGKANTFVLPPEHAACLTRAAGANNLATVMQFIPLLAEVESSIVQSFRRGGGVPYSEYPRFQKLMADASDQVAKDTLVQRTLPLVPGLIERLQAGIDVLDLGCGRGAALALMAKAFPKSRFVGLDISEAAIETARDHAASEGLTNIRFEEQDAATLDSPDSFDLVTTFDAIHDQAHPRRVLRLIHQALRKGGHYLMVDIAASSTLSENSAHPLATYLYTVSTMHCMTVSLHACGEGLGTMWGEQKARELLKEAGFSEIEVRRVDGDILNNYYITKK